MKAHDVRVLDADQPFPPPGRQHRSVEVDAVDAESVLFLEGRPFPSDALDQICQLAGRGVGLGDWQDVDLHRHGCLGRQLFLAEAAEDRL